MAAGEGSVAIVRVSGPDKDDLQGAIALLKSHDFGIELNFGNFRSN